MTFETTQLLAVAATVYGIGGALSVLLQAQQIRARGSSHDVSLGFLATYVGGYAVWLLYGLSMHSIPIATVNGLGLVTGVVTLSVALKLRRPRARPGSIGDHGRAPPDVGRLSGARVPAGSA